ncbi:hypothetical protein [Ornithinibacillus xuwenensis]|uniref:Spore coat protein n=1 Tax=Ornithinibacillus xuwenensis TaxID=3144668 RepID=A0ABU9XLA3_9BACI
MKQSSFKKTAAGKYKELKTNKTHPQKIQPPEKQSSHQVSDAPNHSPKSTKIYPINAATKSNKEKTSKQKSGDGVNELEALIREKIKEIFSTIKSEKGKAYVKNMLSSAGKYLQQKSFKGVMNTMSKDKKMSDVLKNLGDNVDTSEMLKTMMNDPAMKETAMDMMQEMMNDEKKMAEMTEMMSKMLNKED